jgi:osmotically-inducible protein OsmY
MKGENQMKMDADIQRDVLDELKWEPAVHSEDIGITVKEGVVMLAGFVDSYPEKWTAERPRGIKVMLVEPSGFSTD